VHPDWNTIQDIGQTDKTVFTFRAANSDYLVGAGILRAGQLNYSYDGSPSWFMLHPDSAIGGFATNEPYIYKGLGRDVAYAYVGDTGYPDYRNQLTVRAGAMDGLAPCLRQLVPVLQRGMVDFMARPDPVLKLIVDLDRAYTSPGAAGAAPWPACPPPRSPPRTPSPSGYATTPATAGPPWPTSTYDTAAGSPTSPANWQTAPPCPCAGCATAATPTSGASPST
jgi:hypothetical protein